MTWALIILTVTNFVPQVTILQANLKAADCQARLEVVQAQFPEHSILCVNTGIK